MQGGSMDIIRISSPNKPLALDFVSKGSFQIYNGRWNIQADGENVYAKSEQFPIFPLASDMDFKYTDNGGASRKYLLDARSKYNTQNNDEYRGELKKALANLREELNLNTKEYNELLNKKDQSEIKGRLAQLKKESWKLK